MNPLVSVAIPVYNREHLISKTIESAINQTYKNIEVIIVDNNSTDNTWRILEKYASIDSRIKIFQNSENIGPVRNWNECFKRATGEYIKILWSDDWMGNDFIEKAVKLFDAETSFILSGYEITDGIKCYESISFKEKYEVDYYLNSLLLLNKDGFPVSPGAGLFRRKDILNSFCFDPIPNKDNLNSMNNGAGNDLLLYLNTALRYKYIKTTMSVDNHFRHHASSFSVLDKKIDIYYLWAKLFFIQSNNLQQIENKFKALLFIRKLKNNLINSVFKSTLLEIRSFNDLLEISSFFIKKCFSKAL